MSRARQEYAVQLAQLAVAAGNADRAVERLQGQAEEAQVLPPFVLSGHAASLTPY